MRLLDKSEELTESCGYNEFRQDIYGNQGYVPPFGYMGYQHDRIAGTYFAQTGDYCTLVIKKLPFRNCVLSKNEPINMHCI